MPSTPTPSSNIVRKVETSPTPFSKFGNGVKDLLIKDYYFDNKLVLTILNDRGMLVTATGATRNQIFVGDISTFYKNKSTTLNVKVDTCSNVSTSVTVNGISPSTAASLSFKIPDHKSGNQKRERSIYRITLISTMKLGYLKCCTKVGVMSQSNKRQQFGRVDGTYQLDAQYLHPHAMINSSISLTPSPRLEFAGAIGSKEFSLGGEVGFDASTASFTKYNAGVGLNKPDLSAALMVIGKGGAMTFSFIQKVNPIGATIGAEMTHNLRTHENTYTFGSSYAVDPSTLVKARISHNGKFGMVWQRGWRPKSLITFATEYDSKTMNALPRLGLTLVLSP